MSTAAQASGQIAILETVAGLVADDIIESVFGFGRFRLRTLIDAGDNAALLKLVEKGWRALLLDTDLVTIPPSLLNVAKRHDIAKHLATMLARTPYYTGTKKATPLAHRVTANAALTRATYFQFEKTTIDKVNRLAQRVFAQLREEGGRLATEVIEEISKARPFRRRRILKGYRNGTRGQRFAARIKDALDKWARAYADIINEQAELGRRVGMQRAIDTLYHFEDRRNPWSRISQPLSATELGGIFFTHRHQVLPVAADRILNMAGSVAADVRRDMLDIITNKVFLQGENPRAAAKAILAKYRRELGEKWGGAKVRAERIARTESAYILNEATRISYMEMGVEWVDVIYSEAKHPCDICPPIAESGPYPVKEVPEGGIPFH